MAQSSWIQKKKVQMKVLMPMGTNLSPSETATLAQIYEEDANVINKNRAELSKAIRATDKGLDLAELVDVARKARSQALTTYKRTKDPIKKREWARRIVVADQTIQTTRDTKARLEATKDRLTMLKGDMELQLIEAETRAEEMNAYAAAGRSLRLAGEKLMQARSRANKLGVEYSNLEITMEGAEKAMSKLADEELLAKAEEIIKRGNDE